MTKLRLIDLLKLAPLALAAVLLVGCGAGDEAAPPADEPIGGEMTGPMDGEMDGPAVVEPAEGEIEPAEAPEETPAP